MGFNLPKMKINTADDLLAKSVIFVIAIEAVLCVVEGSTGFRSSFIFTKGSRKIYHEVLEGDTIDLICQQPITDECYIAGDDKEYVRNGSLIPYLPDHIIFNRNDSACILTIINVSRDNQDKFICRYPVFKYLIVKVIYSPPEEYPRCLSNYELPMFFSDQLQVPFEFNCTTEEGDPAVNISLYVQTDGRQKQVNSTDLIITERQLSKSRSFSTYLDSSSNNSSLICRVIQHLPAPYQSYSKSCSFGPLVILSTFSVSINPSRYTVDTNKRENITLTCTSNVSGVELEWTDIPLKSCQYNITKINDSLQLKIFEYGSSIDGSINFHCSGSYGGRNIFNHASVHFVISHHFDLCHLMILALSCIIIVLVTLLLRLYCRRCVCRLATSSSSSSPSSSHAIGQFPRSNTTYTTTIRPESTHVGEHKTNEDDPQVYAHSLTLNQNTEEEAAKYADISENSKYNYDRQLYLVPSQMM
ncbi:uncharacterized protein [Apostichopus japonicus]|uniref:uncharacterized protein isoform X2 n=1 Tax=Stichopus japonicus TaxID=307972 RepID=UPI003AB8C1F1